MASLRPSSLRHLSTPLRTTRLLPEQRRFARVHDVRFVATQNTQDRILDRYRTLLEEKAKKEGLDGDIHKLKDVYKDKIARLRKQAAVPGATAPLPQEALQARHQPHQPTSTKASSSPWPTPPEAPEAQPMDSISPTSPNHTRPGVKTLSSFLDVSKTLELPPKEIEAIWRLRHAHSPKSLCAAIPAKTWEAMYQTARRHPQFILPGLPRPPTEEETAQLVDAPPADGAPIHFLQWTFPSPDTVTVLFTHLAEYKLRGEYAGPHTTITHHLELAGPKGVVLCQGNVIDGRGVSIDEARWLVMCLQKFYTAAGGVEETGIGGELQRRRRTLLEKFTGGDSSFSVEELVSEAERVG